MSNPQKSEIYPARPPDEMRLKTQISGVFSEMPRGEMTEGSSVDMAETPMPAGFMKRNDGLTTSEMPTGQMTGTAPSATEFGRFADQVTGTAGLVESEMPAGQMASAQSATDNGLSVTDMPSGLISASEQAEGKPTDVFPVLEITGEWLLTLSPTSFKKSKGN